MPGPRDSIPHDAPTIGRYRIRYILGEGGMGTVYAAEQDHPQRTVALKIIRAGLAAPELVRRFEREAEVLGRLQHPGIAQVFEAGTADTAQGPTPYFAMELVRGVPLNQAAAELPMKARLDLFAKICDAVHYAHQHGVIHRDLKPANILIDETGQPKILDFGIARLTDSDLQVTRQTSVGEVIGTIQYMSPEQVNADPFDIDIRTDVYSLGVILYDILAGKLPYELGRRMIYDAARVILIEDPAPLSTISRDFRGDVETIVGKALEKEKTRRYGSAEEMAGDIRRYLRDEPISARRPSVSYQIGKFARRNRALVSGAGLVVAALIAGTVVSAWQAVRARAAERLAVTRQEEAVIARTLAESRRAEAEAERAAADSARTEAQVQQRAAEASAMEARREAGKALAVNNFLQEMLGSSDPSVAQGRDLTIEDVLTEAGQRAGSSLRATPEVDAAVQATLGRTYQSLGNYDGAGPHLDSALAIRRRMVPRSDLELAESLRDRGFLAHARGDYLGALALHTEALAIRRRRLPPNDDRIVDQYHDIGDLRYRMVQNAEAERWHREGLALRRQRHRTASGPLANSLKSLASFLQYVQRPAEAEPLFRESVTMFRKVHGENHPNVAAALMALGDARRSQGDFAGAEAIFREVLVINRKLHGEEHPAVANALERIGGALASQQKREDAEPLIRQSLAMKTKILGDNHPDVQLARVSLGRLLIAGRRMAEADTVLRLALAARISLFGDSSAPVASSHSDLGFLAEQQGQWPAAEDHYRQAQVLFVKNKAVDTDRSVIRQIGWAQYQQGKLGEADSVLQVALADLRARHADSPWEIGDALEKLAGVALARKDLTRAVDLSEQGLAITGAVRPSGDANLEYNRMWLGNDLCATGETKEGEALLRSSLAATPVDTTGQAPLRPRIQSHLGACLTKLGRYDEAVPPLLEAEAGLAKLARPRPQDRTLAIKRLVTLYEAWGKPAEAAEWRGREP